MPTTPLDTPSGYLTPKAIANLCAKAVKHGDTWAMRCPAHEDRQASLTVKKGRKATLMYCHAGCTAHAILEELGHTVNQLYHDYNTDDAQPDSATSLKLRQMMRDSVAPTMRELAPAHTLEDVIWPVIVADPYVWTWVRVRWADYMQMPYVEAMRNHRVVTDAICADLMVREIDNGYDYTVAERHRLRDRLEEQWEQTQPVKGI
jgi:hypothetical protein